MTQKPERSIINLKSSEKLQRFLEKNDIHKKDFAEMIGVTLSYVYNLIDNTIPFSSRSTTIERIACVMDVEPEEFDEYKIPQEPILIDESTQFLKDKLKEKNMSTQQFLKSFPRKKRVEIVDILRGATPIPLDWKELNMIATVLNVNNEEIYQIWENRLLNLFDTVGLNVKNNQGLIDSMFDCARNYILKK